MHRSDVSLYGHLTLDRVFIDFKEYRTLGAIGNVWWSLLKLDSSLCVDLKPSSFGEAIILVDKAKKTRQGRGILNLKTIKPQVSNAGWHHIAYLNQIEDPSFIEEIRNATISADITSGKKNHISFLKYVDYFFISDEDLFMPLEELTSLVKGWVILHFPSGSIITNGDETYRTKVEIIDNINVLGAGDILAASFIFEKIRNSHLDIADSIKQAHKHATRILSEKNE